MNRNQMQADDLESMHNNLKLVTGGKLAVPTWRRYRNARQLLGLGLNWRDCGEDDALGARTRRGTRRGTYNALETTWAQGTRRYKLPRYHTRHS